MKMLQKVTDCESVNTNEDVTEINWLRKFENLSILSVKLHCSDFKFALKRTHKGYFSEYVPKTSYLAS